MMRSGMVSMLMVAAVSSGGCTGDEPSPPAASSAQASTEQVKVEEPEAVPVEQNPTPGQLAAREAFAVMTTDGVRPEDVETATQELIGLGTDALPTLAEGLESERSIEREQAATVLAMMGADAGPIADQLISALDDSSAFVRANVATALAQMEGQAEHVIPVFGEFLESDDSNLQTMAVMNLGVLEPSSALPLVDRLIPLLSSEDPMIVVPVVELLGKIGPEANAALEPIKALDASGNAELETAVNAALLQIDREAE